MLSCRTGGEVHTRKRRRAPHCTQRQRAERAGRRTPMPSLDAIPTVALLRIERSSLLVLRASGRPEGLLQAPSDWTLEPPPG